MTAIDEISDGIYRISTPVTEIPGGFTFNQYLVVDDEPLLFHTGGRRLFPTVSAAIARVMPVARLRWIGFSHVEADECGSLNQFLGAAPQATAVTGILGAMVGLADSADRPARGLADGEVLKTGKRAFVWHDAAHVPHAWECGYLSESTTRTLFCGDLFTQPGADHEPVTSADVLGPSETMRGHMDYWAHAPSTGATLAKLARTEPRMLACMHGSAYSGDGAALLGALATALGA